MGQYYKPTFFDKNADVTANDWDPIKWQLLSYDFGNGAKLMEHSWVHNGFVQAVEYLLSKDKEGTRFVWAGDYAQKYSGFTENLFTIGAEGKCRKGLAELFKDGVLENDKDFLGYDCYQIKNPKDYKFVINHTKKQFVRIPEYNKDEHTIHPLPLLTAESNGLGGGDYWSEVGKEHVGSWKYDKISVGDEVPKGFTELKVKFEE